MTVAQIVPASDVAKARQEVLSLVPTLKAQVETLVIKTDEDYQEADLLLSQIRLGQHTWLEGPKVPNPKSKWRGINAIIAPIYEGLQGLYSLRNEGSAHFDEMEETTKAKMKAFKLVEKERVRLEEEVKRKEQERLQREQDKKAQQLAAAKTAPARERIIERQMEIKQEIKEVKKTKSVTVKAAGSTSRTVRKPLIDNFRVFAEGILQLTESEDEAGLMNLLEANQTALNSLWKEQPDLVESLPGVIIHEDIVIAGR